MLVTWGSMKKQEINIDKKIDWVCLYNEIADFFGLLVILALLFYMVSC